MSTSSRPPLRRRLRRVRRRVAPLLPWLIGASVAALVLLAYLAATSLSAARHASTASTALAKVEADLRAGSPRDARADAHAAAAAARQAHEQAGGALLRAAAAVPVLGEPLRSLRETSAVLDDVASRVALPVVDQADLRLDDAVHSTSFDVSSLAAAAGPLTEAATRLDADVRRLDHVGDIGIGSIDRRLADGRDRLHRAADTLRAVSAASRVAPPMLADGRRYLVLIQNNAESRATGGLIGAYALLTVHDHHLRLTASGPNNDLRDAAAPVVTTDRAGADRYHGLGETTTWRSLNLTPDFPTAASIAAGLWAADGHGDVDGVLAVDPRALSDLLRVIGPVSVPGGPRLSAANAVAYLEAGIYADYPRVADDERNRYLAAVTRGVFGALGSRHVAGTKVLQALRRSVAGRHVQLWSSHPAEQAELAALPLSGAVARDRSPFLEVVTQNLTGGKVDYYLRRAVSYVSTTAPQGDDVGTGPQPMDDAVVTVRLTSTAPAHGLPPYVTMRADLPPGTTSRPGTDRLWVSLYLQQGTGYVGATLNGARVSLHTDEDAGAAVLSTVVELAPGQSTTLRVRLLQPAPSGAAFHYVPQPLAVPDTVEIRRR